MEDEAIDIDDVGEGQVFVDVEDVKRRQREEEEELLQ